VRYHVSSGTTGKPTVVGYTKGDIETWSESLARALTSIGLDSDDVVQVGYGYGLFTGGLACITEPSASGQRCCRWAQATRSGRSS